METKNTPGPWQAAPDCGTTGRQSIYDARGEKIATCWRGMAGDSPTANLIAAAPDLLAACRIALDFAAEKPSIFSDVEESSREEMAAAMRSAIAKAEGAAKGRS